MSQPFPRNQTNQLNKTLHASIKFVHTLEAPSSLLLSLLIQSKIEPCFKYFSIITYKLPIIAHKFYETMHALQDLRTWPFLRSHNFLGIYSHPILTGNMTQVFNLCNGPTRVARLYQHDLYGSPTFCCTPRHHQRIQAQSCVGKV